jgi:hypothetical protein
MVLGIGFALINRKKYCEKISGKTSVSDTAMVSDTPRRQKH